MKKIGWYILFTFLLTYFSHSLLAYLTTNNYIDFHAFTGQVLFIIGGSSPTLFGILFILKNASREKKKRFLSRLFSYRHKPIIWIFAIATPVLIGGFFQLGYVVFKEHNITTTVPFYMFFIIVFISILFGGLEEIGWRGFLQDQLMKSNNLLFIAIVIGIVWALWHIPLFFIESVSHYNFNFLPFLLGAIMFSTFLTWLYAVTKSLLLVVLFHASINASAAIGLPLVFEHTFLAYFMFILITLIGLGLLFLTQQYNQRFSNDQSNKITNDF